MTRIAALALGAASLALTVSADAAPRRAAPLAARADVSANFWPTALEFAQTPPRARARPGSACETANRYVTYIGSDQAPKVPGLFAPDGEFIGVADKVLRGPAEIATFYNRVHQGGAIPLSFIDSGAECIMELAGMRPGADGGPGRYRLVAIDHFTINPNGTIKRLVIFFRPAATTLVP